MILFYDTEVLQFARWRALIARAAGYGNEWMDLGEFRIAVPALDYSLISDKNVDGIWDAVPNDPLLILLSHRDEGGYFEPEYGIEIADALDALKSSGKLRENSTHEIETPSAQREMEFHDRLSKTFRIAAINKVRLLVGG